MTRVVQMKFLEQPKMKLREKLLNPGRAVLVFICVGVLFGHPVRSILGQINQQHQADEEEAEQVRLLIEQILREGVTQADLESSTSVMQDLAEGRISEDVAVVRLRRYGDGKLADFLSQGLFRHLFQKADPTEFIQSLRERGFNTLRLEELQSSINFYFRPQTENQSAQWEFITNTLFIPIEFKQTATAQVRADLRPFEVNTIIHELDHAEKDLRNDLLRISGKSFWNKIHAGFCWGGLICVVGLVVTTVLGSLHRLQGIWPALNRLSGLAFLTRPQTALAVVVGATGVGLVMALVCHLVAPAQYSDLREMEQENSVQLEKIGEIINGMALQNKDSAPMVQNEPEIFPRQIREAVRIGTPGALGGAAIGLLLGLLGFGPRMLGQLRILKAFNYPWAMAITCGLIGAIAFGSFGAWRTNQFSKIKAWEVSGYYSGYCVQQILEGQEDIAFYNTQSLQYPSLDELVRLKTLDERGSFKLLLPQRMFRVPDAQHAKSTTMLAQLAADFPGEFQELGVVGSQFQAYLAGVPIEFPYQEYPQVFKVIYRTTLGLGLDKLANDRVRNKATYRGLACFLERSELPFCLRVREKVREARAARIQELMRQQNSND